MKTRKSWLRMSIVALAVLTMLTACATAKEPKIDEEVYVNPDAVAFDAEYTSLNGQTTASGKAYKTVTVGDNPFKFSSFEEINNLIKNGTGVIYLGFPECPWCRAAMPVLNDVARDENIKEILYLNVYDLRDVKKLDANGEVVTEKEGAEGYAELLTLLGDHAEVYDGLNDPSIKRLYVPAVIFVKEGEIKLFHVGTVDTQEDPYLPLTDAQYKELYKIYADATVATLREVCTTEKASC